MKLLPLFDKLIVRELEATTTTAAGIVLLDTPSNAPQQAEVVAVGPGRRNKEGQFIGMAVQVGQIVMYYPNSGQNIKIDGDELVMMDEGDLLAIVEQ